MYVPCQLLDLLGQGGTEECPGHILVIAGSYDAINLLHKTQLKKLVCLIQHQVSNLHKMYKSTSL